MIQMTAGFVANATGAKLVGDPAVLLSTVVTDSRAIRPGCLFVALRGERFDGNDFVIAAFEQGASAALCSRLPACPAGPIMLVADPNGAFLDLARAWRSGFSIPVVGVTGSVGKTTTKQMITQVLSQRFLTASTQGNFNNEVGLPVTVLALREEHQAAVFEMGMNHFREISRLTRCAQPTVAVITNIGTAHMEQLGSREGILQAKLEIVEGLQPDGVLLVNGDEPLLWEKRGTLPCKVLTFGLANTACDFFADQIEELPDGSTAFHMRGTGCDSAAIPTAGRHNVANALCAAAVGHLLGLAGEEIAAGLAEFENAPMRQSIRKYGTITVIADCYNANPDSMQAALAVLRSRNGRRIAVLGDMLELGADSGKLHWQVGLQTAYSADILYCCGIFAGDYTQGALEGGMAADQVRGFSDLEALCAALRPVLLPGDQLLLKGSRGARMERALTLLFEGEHQ